MKHLLPILLLATAAHADTLQLDIGYPVDVRLYAPLPDQFAYAITGGLVQWTTASDIVGGAYFPDGAGDHGWTILPPIPATNTAPSPWAFEVLASNPAEWRIDVDGTGGAGWNVVGEVTTGHDYLLSLASAPYISLGNLAFPMVAGGFLMVSDVTETADGFPIFTPEPGTLSLFGVGILLLNRRAA